MANDRKFQVRLPSDLKAAALAASLDKRGGLSGVIRELRAAWLARRKL